MSRLGLALILLSLIVLPACGPSQPETVRATQLAGVSTEDGTSDGVFVHIKSGIDRPREVLMGLEMAAMMAPERDVLVYFDVDAVQVVLADAPDLAWEQFPGSHFQLENLLGKGVKLLACRGCLEAMDKSKGDLREGIRLASKDAFFEFTEGRIITFDY